LAWKFGSDTCVWFSSVARCAVCHHRLASTGFHALKICAARWNFASLCCLALRVAVINVVVAVVVAVLFWGVYTLPCRFASRSLGKIDEAVGGKRKKNGPCCTCLSTAEVTADRLWLVVPPLQLALSFACSVASLSRSPSH